jgi:fructose-bisphosphate aldolase class II
MQPPARRTEKLYNPRKWLGDGETHLVTRLNEAFADLKSAGKSLARGSCGGGKNPPAD